MYTHTHQRTPTHAHTYTRTHAHAHTKVRVLEPDDGTMRALTPRKRASAGLNWGGGKDITCQMALGAVANGLYHHHWLARWRAIQVLQDTVPRGDEDGVRELLRLCGDDTPEVRVAAAEALCAVVGSRGQPGVTDVLARLCLGDHFDCVRAAAVRSIERLGKMRCEPTTALLVKLLVDRCPDVRDGAVHALSKLSDVGDEVATLGLVSILRHCEERRRIVEHALLRWKLSNEDVDPLSSRHINTHGQAPKTHIALHANVMAKERDVESGTRVQAVMALERIAVKGHAAVIAALEWTLNDAYSRRASAALQKVACRALSMWAADASDSSCTQVHDILVCVRVRACVRAFAECIHIHVHMQSHVHAHIYSASLSLCVCECLCVHATCTYRSCARAHTRMHACMHAYILTYIL